MELAEAFELLTAGATGRVADRAFSVIRERALILARRDGRLDEATAQDCAQLVVTKLWTRFASGDNPVRRRASEACAVYIRQMVTNWIHDKWKTEHRQREIREQVRKATPPDAPLGPGERDADAETTRRRGEQVRELLGRVAAHAIAARRPHHRHHLEQGWHEIEQLVFEHVPLSALLRPDTDASEPSSAAWTSLRSAAYKRHERTRAALAAAAHELEEEGSLTAADAELARLVIANLARRQRRTPGENT